MSNTNPRIAVLLAFLCVAGAARAADDCKPSGGL